MDQRQRKQQNIINQRKNIPSVRTDKEFQDFIEQSLNKRDGINRRINIGQTTEDTQNRIRDLYGKSASYIDIDSSGVVHAYDGTNHLLNLMTYTMLLIL